MKRSSFDDDKPLPPHGAPPLMQPRLPCHKCAEPTLLATLSQYGGQCFECFELYCTEIQDKPKRLSDEEKREVRARFAALSGISPAGRK